MTRAQQLFCIGAAHWDIIGHSPANVALGADMPGQIIRRPGGVALNIASGLAAQGLAPALIAAIAQDAPGQDLRAWLGARGVLTDHLITPARLPTDTYIAIEGANGLIAAIAASDALESLGADMLDNLPESTACVVLDSGLAPGVLAELAQAPRLARRDLRLAAASPAKAARLAPFLGRMGCCFYLNLAEAGALCATTFPDSASAARTLIARGAARVLVTDGPNPAIDATGAGFITATPPRIAPRRVTGAGDAFAAAHICAELQGQTRAAALKAALAAATAHVASPPPEC
jgi:pseudouridine kinase